MISTTLLNFSCGQNVESSPIAANEKPAETLQTPIPRAAPTPDKYEEIDIVEQFSALRNDETSAILEFKNYKIKRVTVKKREDDSPEADIYDAVISKNGKTIRRFAGSYHPLGNLLGFGFYQFLKGSEKQLLIIDESNRYDREWIVSLSPKFDVLFDTADFGVEGLMTLDVDNDGEKEITAARFCFESEFDFAMSERPWLRVVFKYDAKAHKYLPASHIFTDYTLSGQNERKEKFFESFMTYIYAGQEKEAWKFFDENMKGKDIEQTRAKIKASLKEDPIYKFIRKDLRSRK
jgi:hypothetical protein